MIRKEVLNNINDIFNDIFNDESIVITEASSAKDIDEWDSLNNIQIVVAVEKKFKIRFKASEISGWNNVGEMCDSIETLLQQK
ncbi:acyl carrier protein [Candidatus Methylospira mobilis]|uniref:Acyl carrier protein n=1 Tax=Candidatus Methylospira mobilis TaxID=1808979 RepID=A0A5Q0BGP1_9GAMM|nr:acyl carrier protein [Candidatus Methylospira mobilis]QFY41381.1 acyl carrier protein [Candidatus Methylospira mobilis]